MNIEQLRAFIAVVEYGTLSRAAEGLQLSQSTVSFRIKGLEESVGTRLLDRGGGEAKATGAGLLLLPYAQRILETAHQAAERIRGEAKEPSGEVCIAASTVPAEYLLPPLLGAFCQRYPAVSLKVRVSDSHGATRALLDGECALAFVGADERDKRRVIGEPFALDEIVLVGAPGGPTKLPKRLLPQQLGGWSWVRREEGSGTRRAIDALLAEHQLELAGSIQLGSSEAVRRCVLAGLGVAFISRAAVERDLAEGTLQRIGFPGTPLRRRFYRLRLRTKSLSAAEEAFWEHSAASSATSG